MILFGIVIFPVSCDLARLLIILRSVTKSAGVLSALTIGQSLVIDQLKRRKRFNTLDK